MKTKILLFVLLFVASTTISWAQITGISGTGVASEPYLIATPADLIAAKMAINTAAGTGAGAAYYKLTADIDMSTTPNFYGGIGTYTNVFKGNFDGAGFKITGLTTGGSETSPFLSVSSIGFFNYVADATISNLSLDVAFYVSFVSTTTTTTGAVCGGLVGGTTTSTKDMLINNCKVTGTIYSETLATSIVECRATTGGIIGAAASSNIINIINTSVDASLTAKNNYAGIAYACAGGIVGQLWNTTGMIVDIVNCTAAGSVNTFSTTTNSIAGGIFSAISFSIKPIVKVMNCMATNAVTSTGYSAALYNQIPALGIGPISNAASSIKNCMALNPSISVVNKTTGASNYALNRVFFAFIAPAAGNIDMNFAKSDMKVQTTVNGVGPTNLTLTKKSSGDCDGEDLGKTPDAEAKSKLEVYIKANPVFSDVPLNTWGGVIPPDNTDSIIAASQGGASPLIFDIPLTDRIIPITTYVDAKEFYVRGGLPNFIRKANNKDTLRISYLGGSISQNENRFRNQSARYFQSIFPDSKIVGMNAGISGTGTNLGCCRIYEQVIKYNPDLVFIEFAVNAGPDEAMEGMVRKIWNYNPRIDICFLYSIYEPDVVTYQNGGVPANITRLEAIASKYNIPSIHMGQRLSMMVKDGTAVFKAAAGSTTKKIFSNDGVHPTQLVGGGGDIYAEAVCRGMQTLKLTATDQAHTLPTRIYTDNWEDAQMISPKDICTFSSGWTAIDPTKTTNGIAPMAGWFPYIMRASTAGESMTFSFTGNSFGYFEVGAPESGQLEINLDGKNVTLTKIIPTAMKTVTNTGSVVAAMNSFNSSCSYPRGQFMMFNVTEGFHTVKLSVSAVIPDKKTILGSNLTDINANPAKYNQHVLYIGKILLRGTYERINTGTPTTKNSNVKVFGTNECIKIEGCENKDYVEVYSISSQLIKRVSMAHTQQISVPKGIYIVKYISKSYGIESFKVIVQ
jgi:hypothetical protein